MTDDTRAFSVWLTLKTCLVTVGVTAAFGTQVAPAFGGTITASLGMSSVLARGGNVVYTEGVTYGIPGGLVEVSPTNGSPKWTGGVPAAWGGVTGMTDDGADGWYVVDAFGALRHVTGAGQLDPVWRPAALTGSAVAITRGGSVVIVVEQDASAGTVYVDGISTGVDAARVWRTAITGGVADIAASASTVFIAGSFTAVGGSARSGLAALDVADGSLAAGFDPVLDAAPGHVGLDPSGSVVYVAGSFTSIDGASRDGVAALATTDGTVDPAFAPTGFGGAVTALAVDDGRVYAGYQRGVGPPPADAGVAALERSDGTVAYIVDAYPTEFSESPLVSSIARVGDTLYVSGGFEALGGRFRNGAAAIDLPSGVVTAWAPKLLFDDRPFVGQVRATGSAVLLEGRFSMTITASRHGLAAFDFRTGALLPFDVAVDGEVNSLVVRGSTLYVGGAFTSLGGRHRHGLGAVDLRTGRVTPWNPRPNGPIGSLAVAHGVVYVGGTFTRLGGTARRNFAALSAATGHARPLDLAPRFVTALAVSGHRLYLAGLLGRRQPGIAAVDLATGRLVRSFGKGVAGLVRTIGTSGSTVYIGGEFSRIQGHWRNGVAALRAGDGALLRWNPLHGIRPGMRPLSYVMDLAVSGGTVYLAGGWNVTPNRQQHFMAVSATTGGPRRTPGGARADEVVRVVVHRRHVFAAGDGGLFSWLGPLS